MAEEQTKPNGKLNGEWTNWPMATGACKKLGISLAQLQALVRDGIVQSFRAPNNTLRFKPEWLEEYVTDLQEIPIGDEEELKDRQAARSGIPSDAIRATADLLKAAQSQNLELHKLVIQGFKASHDAQDKTIERLLSRLDKTEGVINQLYEAREAYFDAQLERQIVLEQHKAAGERRTQMWTLTTQYLGDLVQGAKKKWGLDDASTEKLGAAAQLLQTMTAEQIEVAAMMGFFNDEQCDLIEKIIGRKVQRPAKKSPENTATPNAEAGASTASASASGGEQQSPPASTAGTREQPAPETAKENEACPVDPPQAPPS